MTADLAARALQQAGDGIIVIDTDGIIRVWNDHCVALFGHTAEQAIGSVAVAREYVREG